MVWNSPGTKMLVQTSQAMAFRCQFTESKRKFLTLGPISDHKRLSLDTPEYLFYLLPVFPPFKGTINNCVVVTYTNHKRYNAQNRLLPVVVCRMNAFLLKNDIHFLSFQCEKCFENRRTLPVNTILPVECNNRTYPTDSI